MQAAKKSTVINAVPQLLHRLLKRVNAVTLVNCRVNRGIIGVIGGISIPPRDTYDISFNLTGISTVEAIQYLAGSNETVLVIWTAHHADGTESKASKWHIDRYHLEQIVLTVTTLEPMKIDRLTVQIAELEPLSWNF
ncbi:MAG: hypothetical protein Q7S48_02155 [bacterium]|nr:hypothetical protein [bacterium]